MKVKKLLMVKLDVWAHTVAFELIGRADVRAKRAKRARMTMLKADMVINSILAFESGVDFGLNRYLEKLGGFSDERRKL